MQIAVSSGHTRSIVLAYGNEAQQLPNGDFLVVNSCPSLNIHCLVNDTDGQLTNRLNNALTTVRESLPPSLRDRGFTKNDRLAISLPGVSTNRDLFVGENCVLKSHWLSSNPPNFCVVDDTYSGLIAGALSTCGICAFAGTGASVYMGTPVDGRSRAFTPAKPFKLDGFGPMLGDHGSGFRLAMTALERFCRELDVSKVTDSPPKGRGIFGLPKVFEDIEKAMEKNYRFDSLESRESFFLQNWFDDLMSNRSPEWRFQIADLAKVITKAAADGDPFSQDLVEEAASGIVTTLRRALALDDFADMHSAPIYCQGGMFRYSSFFHDKVIKMLGDQGTTNRIELARYLPSVGTLLVAASPNWTVPNTYTIELIEQAIAHAPPDQRFLLFNKP